MITCVFLMEKFQDMLPNPYKKGQMGLRNIRTGVVSPSAKFLTGQATIGGRLRPRGGASITDVGDDGGGVFEKVIVSFLFNENLRCIG